MDTRNTRQKGLILEVLKSDCTHPTIQQLYEKVIKKDPHIGQATVYRTIHRLVKEKKVRRVSISQDLFRYDADLEMHHHLFCTKCERIIDLYDDDCLKIQQLAEEKYQIEVFETMVTFTGICQECLKKL